MSTPPRHAPYRRYEAEYHRVKRMWYLWNGREAILDGEGKMRLFLTAQDAYEWLAGIRDAR
jgi:hypothetical protein